MTSRSFKRPFISKSRRPARARVTSLAAYVRSNPTFTSTFQPGGQAEQLQARERALRVDARHASHFGGAGEPGGDQGSSAKPVLQTSADLPVAQGQDSDNSSDLDRVSRAMNLLTLDREEIHRANNGLPSEDELRALQDPHALLFEAINTALSALKKLRKGRKLHNGLGLATPTYVGTGSGLPAQVVGMVGRPCMACETIEGLYESAVGEGKEAAMMLGVAAQWIDREKAQVRDSIMMRRVTF